MSERTVSLAEAKARLSELIKAAQSGEDVVITKRGKAVARLVAEPQPRPPVDLAWLRELTEGMTYQEETSATLIRRMRDDARY
jgi:prevent-host-death family protein